MTVSVVVIPHAARGALADAGLRRQLSRGDVALSRPPSEALARVLEVLGVPVPVAGLAALRYFADSGCHPAGWIAAADPVHFETRLRHLVVHPLVMQEDEVQAIFATLEAELGGGCAFECIGPRGYVHAVTPFATVPVSADSAVGDSPDAIAALDGDPATFHRLLSEIQMILHDHPVNRQRAIAGHAPVNSLWLWGGGMLPAATGARLPPLAGRDPLFTGYWRHSGGELAPASPATAARTDRPFVSIFEDAVAGVELALKAARRRRVTVVSRDGLTAELGPRYRFRLWRGTASALMAANGHD